MVLKWFALDKIREVLTGFGYATSAVNSRDLLINGLNKIVDNVPLAITVTKFGSRFGLVLLAIQEKKLFSPGFYLNTASVTLSGTSLGLQVASRYLKTTYPNMAFSCYLGSQFCSTAADRCDKVSVGLLT
jgi:hypothetical protein